jgi:hypothetical protein
LQAAGERIYGADQRRGPGLRYWPPGLRRTPAAQERLPQSRWDVAGIVAIQGGSRWHDLVDPVEDVAAQRDIGGAQLRLELLHGARPDDRGRDRRMGEGEGNRQVDQ